MRLLFSRLQNREVCARYCRFFVRKLLKNKYRTRKILQRNVFYWLTRKLEGYFQISLKDFKFPWRFPTKFSNQEYLAQFTSEILFFFLPGFAVILLILHYLQKGCAVPVIPSLQSTFSQLFSKTSSILSLAENLCNTDKESVPYDVRTYSSRNKQTLGELFVGFFKFYSTFSWEKVISVRTGDYISLSFRGTWKNPQIRIEDPYELGNVTKAVYEHSTSIVIKDAFKKALMKLEGNPSLTAIMQ